MPASSSWVTGRMNSSAAVGELEQALRGATGDVEEHRVGEHLVHRPQPLRQQPRDVPQQPRLFVEHLSDRCVRDGEHAGRLERSRHRRARSVVEHPELAEQVARLHQRHDALAAVDRVGDGDGDPAPRHDVQRVGRVASLKRTSPRTSCAHGPAAASASSVAVVGVGEEIGGCQHVPEGGVILGHDGAGYYPASVTDVAVSSDETVWTVVVGGGGGSPLRRRQTVRAARLVSASSTSPSIRRARRATGVVVVVPAEPTPSASAPSPAGRRAAQSVRAGLSAVPDEATIICVHDAARPLATPDLFVAVIEAVRAGADGAVPAVAVTDTIKIVDDSGLVVATPDRGTLVAVQTPQAFRAGVLRRAHAEGGDGTDDAALVERLGGRVVVVPGEAWNRKITEPDDLVWARRWLAERTA